MDAEYNLLPFRGFICNNSAMRKGCPTTYEREWLNYDFYFVWRWGNVETILNIAYNKYVTYRSNNKREIKGDMQ